MIRIDSDLDVRLGRSERRAVVTDPLFFCPEAGSVAADNSLGVATIAKGVSGAQQAGLVNGRDQLGRNAIDNVLNCRPSTLARVVATLNVINHILVKDRGTPAKLSSSSIVAAVFRIADFNEIKRMSGMSNEELAARAGVDTVLVESLARNFRLHLDATLRIFDALRTHPTIAASKWSARLSRPELRGNIVVDATPHKHVMRVSEDNDGKNPVYALDADNLSPAPLDGHDWAIRSSHSVEQREDDPALR